MKVIVCNRQKVLSIDPKSVQAVVIASLTLAHKAYDEVTIHFVEEAEICKLHEEYFDDPSPTDCISFPMDTEEDIGYLVLGDVIISPKAALDYTKNKKRDPYLELTLYLIHGLLHLLGYDDMTESGREEMRTLEKIHLDHLHSLGVYLKQ